MRALVSALAALACCLAATQQPAASAGDVELTADVDSQVLTTDDTLYLTVSLTASGSQGLEEPELSPSKDFAVLGRPQKSVSYSIVNTRISKQSQHVFALKPLRAGMLRTPSAHVTVAGVRYDTQPVEVEVRRGAGGRATPSAPEPEVATPEYELAPGVKPPFSGTPPCVIVCKVDDKKPYRGQQVTLTAELFRSQYVDAKLEPAASAGGFIVEELQSGKRSSDWVYINGLTYEHASFQWALMPLETGTHSVTAPVLLKEAGGEGREFRSNAVQLDVRPLPPAPAGAEQCAVGDFTVRLSAEKSQVKAGEGFTATVVVDGVGDVSPITRPTLRVPDWCKVYESGEDRKTETRPYIDRQVIGGTATFEYLVVPRKPGPLAIEPVELPYFRISEGRYATASSGALTVNVMPGEVIQDADADTDAATLHHIKADSPRLRARPVLLFGPLPGIVVGACVLALLLGVASRVKENRRRLDPDRALAQGAARAALRALGRAAQASDEEFYPAVEEAVTQYLADRFGLPLSGLTAQQAAEGLLERGAGEQASEMAMEIISACHASRYAPGATRAASRARVLELAHSLVQVVEHAGGQADAASSA